MHITQLTSDLSIYPVNSNTLIRNLFKLQTLRCSLVLRLGNKLPLSTLPDDHPFIYSHVEVSYYVLTLEHLRLPPIFGLLL